MPLIWPPNATLTLIRQRRLEQQNFEWSANHKDGHSVLRSYPVLTGLWRFIGKVTRLRLQILVVQQNWLRTKKCQNLALIQSANYELDGFL